MPTSAQYRCANERVDWSVCDPVKVFLFFLDGIFSRRGTRLQWSSIDVVVSADHGKGFSRVHAVFICRKRKDDGTWTEQSDSYSLAEAKCKKDAYEILHNTYMPQLNNVLHLLVEKGGVDVWKKAFQDQDEELGDRFYTSLAGSPPKNHGDVKLYDTCIPVEVFFAGDISQIMTNYGREGMGSYWCPYCTLGRDQWQGLGHVRGLKWTLATMASQLIHNNNHLNEKDT